MDDQDVRIVQVAPMRVVSFYGFGESPELTAWQKLIDWAGPHGLLVNPGDYRIFGFNNPSPSPGSPNYGYEFWLTVDPDALDDAAVTIREFAGGRYAVTRCQGVENITKTWSELVKWLVERPYQHGSHQWLEEHLGTVDAPVEEWIFDLYAPIAE